MPRLVLSLDGVVLQGSPDHQGQDHLGRRPYNDIVIDNLAVSGEHAVLQMVGADVFIEDLEQHQRHLHQRQGRSRSSCCPQRHGRDRQVQIKYLVDGASGTEGEVDIDTSQPLKREFYGPGPATIQIRQPGSGEDSPAAASIKILNGANEGRELQLVKALTTIGRPGHQVAVITRRPTGYFIAHVEGEVFPTVNGANLGSAAHPLKNKDVIELAGVRMEFLNAPAV